MDSDTEPPNNRIRIQSAMIHNNGQIKQKVEEWKNVTNYYFYSIFQTKYFPFVRQITRSSFCLSF